MKIITCWYCGNEMPSERGSSERAFHAGCYEKFQTERDKQKNDYLRLKTEVMFERALKCMERQINCDLSNYYDEAELVHEMALNDYSKFQSSDEMMVAMELVRNRIKSKAQYRVEKRRIDFLIPSMNVALEVDGNLHKFKILKDSQREVEIMGNLKRITQKDNWEVIRIPTDLIEKDLTKLVPAIKTLYKKRQQLRNKNGGFIPTYWSRTNRDSQLEALNNVSDRTKDSYSSQIEDENELQL